MKRIIFILLILICSNISNALEYHFPNNDISRLEGMLNIHFKIKQGGFANIISRLENIPDLPPEYSEFLQYAETKETSIIVKTNAIYGVYVNAFFEGGVVNWNRQDMRLDITESKFKRALKKLEIGEEKNFYKIKLDYYAINKKHPKMIEIDVPEPEILIMKCKRIDKQNATCWFVDENGNTIKELVFKWKVSYPTDLEDQIKKEIKRIEQEKIKEDRQWDKKWEAIQKECPGLYRTLNFAQQGGYVDPVIGMKAAKRFQELNCDIYLQNQIKYGK